MTTAQTRPLQDRAGGTEFLTTVHLERFLAGCARLDAALRALCPRCGGRVEEARDLGSTFVECPDCYWCERVEAAPVGLLVDRRA